MGTRTMAAALLVTAALAGCGDDEPDNAKSPPPPPALTATEPEPEPPESVAEAQPEAAEEDGTAADKFTGQDRENYDIAKEVCGAFPPDQVASDLGLSGNRGRTSEDLVTIAEAYAESYRGSSQQAAFAGCLEGLPDAAE